MGKRDRNVFDQNIENQYRQELDNHTKLDKLKLKERLRKERLARDQSTVYFLCLFGIFNMAMIVVPMLGDSWLFTSFIGPGIGLAEIRCSLFMMSVDISCEKNYLEKKICTKILDLGVSGVHPISKIMHLSCGLGIAPQACDIMTRLWWDSWIIIFFFSLACLSQFFGVVFLYYYWNIAPAKAVRKWAAVFTCFSPFSIIIGLGMYWGMHPELEQLVRAWGGMMDAIASSAGGLLSFKSIHPWGTGWCLIWGCVTFVSTALNAMTFPLCLQNNEGEDELEDLEEYEKDKLLMETLMIENSTGSYGAVEAQGPSAYGGAIPMQQAQGAYGGAMPMSYSSYSSPAGGGYDQGYDPRAGPPVPNQLLPQSYQQQSYQQAGAQSYQQQTYQAPYADDFGGDGTYR